MSDWVSQATELDCTVCETCGDADHIGAASYLFVQLQECLLIVDIS